MASLQELFEQRKKNFMDFVDSVEGYEMIDPEQFVNATTKIEMKHEVCGTVWGIVPDAFKNTGRRCPSCANKSRGAASKTRAGMKYTRWNVELVQAWLNENKPGWSITGDYKNASTPTGFICEKGHEIEMRWKDIKGRGDNCPICSRQARTKTQKEFDKEVYDLTNGEYFPIGEYKGNKVKVDILHTKCMEIYSVRPDVFLTNGSRCSCESESRGQKAMRNILQAKGFNFAEEVRFDQCRYKSTLPFDFVVYKDDNKTIDFIIEVDGEFHRQSIMGSDLEGTQLRDSIKTKYCEENEIPLLRIEYNDGDTSNFQQELEGILNG